MNCCHNSNQNNNQHDNGHNHKGAFSHMWMMALCCGVPVILLLLLPVLGSKLTGIKGILSVIVPFLCPVMMLAMLPMMFKKKSSEDSNK